MSNASKRVQNNENGPWKDWPETDRAERCIRFIETYCTLPKGHGTGQRMKLAPFQKKWLRLVIAKGISSAVLSLPRGNGKSTLLAAMCLWALFDADESMGMPQVVIIATTVGQAIKSVYKVAIAMVDAEPELSTRSLQYTAIGATKLTTPYNNGELSPLASDAAGLQGLDPTLGVVDELGFIGQDSWDALLLASGKRQGSLVVGIGTPGLDRLNALWNLRALVTEHGSIEGFSYTEYAAQPNTHIDDIEQWHLANPALAEGYMELSALQTVRRLSPAASFQIFRLGMWVDGVDSWLGADGRAVWEDLKARYDFEERQRIWVGIDVGLKRDSTCVCYVGFKEDGNLHAKVKIWVPTKDEPVDVRDVMQFLRYLNSTYNVGEMSFDPRFFDVPAKYLLEEKLPMVEIPQSVERMTPIIGNLYELIIGGEVSVDDDKLFEEQVLNAIPKISERGFTLQKNKSRGRIDAAIAFALAVDRALHKKKQRARIVVL